MDLQAVTGQLYLINGEVQETTAVPGLLMQSAPAKVARSRARDFLLVHLTLTGQAEETAVLAQDLLDMISQQFYQAGGSVTAALRQAITKTNELLIRLNLSGTGDPREGALTCAILRHDELFVLQTGEGLAFLGHNYGVERLPAKKPERITPLGRSAGIDIRYSHHRLQPGDMLLLADPRLAPLPTSTFNTALVDTEIEDALAELQKAVEADSSRLLLVEFTDDAPTDLVEVTPPTQPGKRPLAAAPSVTPQRAAVPVAEQATVPVMPIVETTARKATSEAAQGLSRFTGWLAELLRRLRPPRDADALPAPWPVAASLAVIIPLIVAVVVTGVYLQRGRVRRFAEIKVEMDLNLGLAAQTEEETERRAYYDSVLQLAMEAETLNPNDDEINRLRQQAQGALDRLDDVTRLTARPFYVYNEGVNLTAVVLREGFNGGLYTLDSANSHVYQHQTDESYLTLTTDVPEQIIFREQALGNHIVSNIVDMMWRPRGSAVTREGLAMLDDNGALLTFYPDFNDTRAIPLGFSSEWQFPVAITSFDERLYILDVGAAEIWKYFPDGDSFIFKDDERTIVFTEDPDLDRARDLAIYSEDGSLVAVYEDGRIRYYDTRSGRIQWNEQTLIQNGLQTPLLSPTAVKLVGPGLNASVFVADPASGRIVEISRSGQVLTQFRATDATGQELFANITDFAVAKTPLRIFVTAGNTLFVATQE